MVIQDILGYFSYLNPVYGYTQAARGTSYILNAAGVTAWRNGSKKPQIILPDPLWKQSGPFIQMAAINGAVAIVLKTYFSHKFCLPEDEKRKVAFDTASQYDFIHILPILVLPMCQRPYIAGIFILLGKTFFCGTHYFHAITGNKLHNQLPVIGEYCFVAGWLAMLL